MSKQAVLCRQLCYGSLLILLHTIFLWYVTSDKTVYTYLQGEPLNNYAAVKAAVTMLTDGRYFSLQRQKVTVSTVGVIPKVLQVIF